MYSLHRKVEGSESPDTAWGDGGYGSVMSTGRSAAGGVTYIFYTIYIRF